ncbi:hypothetical protein TNCV_1011191 [Trichonephila clavipes]|uniref:Uncharacterized protein n=1 Tax=Trichonephila clavipes TaxID=2585209 RepID=A0A8X6VX92_TRICX|nr:hypothetical protein TNCV_1011191 [Trichonephila clavipes]
MTDGDTIYLQSHNLGKELKGEGTYILQPPASVVSASTAHKTFRPTDFTTMYSVCTWRVFGGIKHRTQTLRTFRCSNH